MKRISCLFILFLLCAQNVFATEEYIQIENGNYKGEPMRVDVTPTRITIYGVFTVEFEKKSVTDLGDAIFKCVSDPRYEISMKSPNSFILINTYTDESVIYSCKRTSATLQDAVEATQDWGREMIRLNNEFLRSCY